ncbi:PGPGW domain-containing protein [Streptomyces sp. bgisy060]|uniref:PGPGW domain-containing protein n=1 Tax=Streptomyces sp. bgisy060 TaxID=3413775 RepID=UPI003EBF96A8
MTRRYRTGPISPLFAFGSVLTAAGAAMYVLPGPGMLLLALGALVLAAAAAVWVSARHR